MSEQQYAPVPTIGRIVLFKLSEDDAEKINRRRTDAERNPNNHVREGAIVHTGNPVGIGEVYPMIITRVWNEQSSGAVNGQVMLDGNDTYWASSVTHGEGEHEFTWPVRA